MIHDTAIIDPSARLHDSVQVGPWTLIGPNVEIGEGSVVESHVVIKGPTRIGARNHIYQFSTVGEATPDLKYRDEPTGIKISLVLIILFMVAVLSLFINKLTTPRYLSAPELLVNGYYQFPSPKEFSNFQILTSNDIALDKDIFKGKWTLIYFGYTRCPAECPVAMSLIKPIFNIGAKRF